MGGFAQSVNLASGTSGGILVYGPPTPWDFGAIAIGGSQTFSSGNFTNTGDAPLTISGYGLAPGVPLFTLIINGPPITLKPGQTTRFFISCTPNAAGPFTGLFELLVTGAINYPSGKVDIPLKGYAFVPGVTQGQFSPPVGLFPDTQVFLSNTIQFVFSNVGTAAMTIQSIALVQGNQGFAMNPPALQPTTVRYNFMSRRKQKTSFPIYPVGTLTKAYIAIPSRRRARTTFSQIKVQHGDTPFVLPIGGSLVAIVTFTPQSVGGFGDTLRVTAIAGGQPFLFELSLFGTGVQLVPSNILQGTERLVLIAAGDPAQLQASVVDQIVPAAFNYGEDSILIFNGSLFGAPAMEKSLLRILIYYENIGKCDLNVSVATLRPSVADDSFQVVQQDIPIGTDLADGSMRSTYVDFIVTGEIIELKITRPAGSGPCQICGLVPMFEPRGEKVESI